MINRESLPVEFLQKMLVDCVREKAEIIKEQAQYLNEIKDNFKQSDGWCLNRLHTRFNPIRGLTEKINPFKKNEKAIKTLTIIIAKKMNLINMESWEAKYNHATEEVQIGDIVRFYIKEDNFKRRIKCPFHESKQGKHLQVYENTNSYHCFSCKASGKPINFVIAMEKCGFKEAVELLEKF